MNTFWLKVAGVMVILIAGIIVVRRFLPSNITLEPKPGKTLQGVAGEDRKRFLTKPESIETSKQNQQTSELGKTTSPESVKPGQSAESSEKKVEEVILYFTELSEIDKVEAEELLNVAVPARSMTRLPMGPIGLSLMVQNCRQIIEKWPDSWYAYRAKQMLADIPQRYQKIKNITEEELDTSRYFEKRPGTKPFKVKITD